MARKKDKGPEEFWREYEEKTGEKVLAFSLGRYLSGWEEEPEEMWGLLIATDAGFRFHHFAHEGWLDAMMRATKGGEPPKEKTLFIPRARILGAEARKETSLLKRLLSPNFPRFILRYTDESGAEREFIAEGDDKGVRVAEQLLRRE
jgi:hypothetical protein